MNHPSLHDVTDFEIVSAYTLHVYFEDATQQTIDFEPVLHGPIFGPLRDPALFRRVRLDPEAGTLIWPNGASFDPTNLYNWSQDAPAFIAKLAPWRHAEESLTR